MSIDLYGHSNIGSRSINQDYYCINEDRDGCIAVVCDGLGGHVGGEVASKIAAENLVTGLSQCENLTTDDINRVLFTVNRGLIDYQTDNPKFKGMRTTAVGCVVKNNRLFYFNVGDSRFYLFRDGSIKCMTKDHSQLQWDVDHGEISFNDIRGNGNRSGLSRALGQEATGNCVGTIYESVELQPGDAFLLCSDGFWEYVLEEEMEVDLSKASKTEDWIKFMLIRLLLKVNNDNDNLTVIGGMIDADNAIDNTITQEDLNSWSGKASHSYTANSGIEFSQTSNAYVPPTVETESETLPSTQEVNPVKSEKSVKARKHKPYSNDLKPDKSDEASHKRHSRRPMKRKRVKKIMGIPMNRSNKIIIGFIIFGLLIVFITIGIGAIFSGPKEDSGNTEPTNVQTYEPKSNMDGEKNTENKDAVSTESANRQPGVDNNTKNEEKPSQQNKDSISR